MARAYEIGEDEISDEEHVDVAVPGDSIEVSLIKNLDDFLVSRGRSVIAIETKDSISRLTSMSRFGHVTKGRLIGDPYTDLKTILFNVRYTEIPEYIIRSVPAMFMSISDVEFNKLFTLCTENDRRLTFFVRNGLMRMTEDQKFIAFNKFIAYGNFSMYKYCIANGINRFYPHNLSIGGNIELFDDVLETYRGAGIDINNLLAVAIEHDKLDFALHLINKGADIINKDYGVIDAAFNKKKSKLKFLVEVMGADPFYNHNKALKEAAEHGATDIVEYLIQIGADVSESEYYALRWAARNGHYEIVKLLLEKDSRSKREIKNALRWTLKEGHEDIAKLLGKYL